MKPNIPNDQKFDELLHQHERLLELMDQLHRSVKSEIAYESLHPQLRELRQELVDHFVHEEAGGNLQKALPDSPQVQSLAARLLKQHQVLLQDLDALIAIAQTTDREAAAHQDFFDKLTRFVAAFHEHEHQENRLLQDAANENLGTVD